MSSPFLSNSPSYLVTKEQRFWYVKTTCMVRFGTKQVLGLFPQPHVLLGQLFTRQAHIPLQHTFLLLHHSFVLKDLCLSLELMACSSVRSCRSQANSFTCTDADLLSSSFTSLVLYSAKSSVAPHHPSFGAPQGRDHTPPTSGSGVPFLLKAMGLKPWLL